MQALDYNCDPLLNVIVRYRVTSDDLIGLPYLLSLNLDNFVDERLGNSYPLFVKLRAVIVVNDEHVLVNAHKYLFHVQFVNQFLYDLRDLKQAF